MFDLRRINVKLILGVCICIMKTGHSYQTLPIVMVGILVRQ